MNNPTEIEFFLKEKQKLIQKNSKLNQEIQLYIQKNDQKNKKIEKLEQKISEYENEKFTFMERMDSIQSDLATKVTKRCESLGDGDKKGEDKEQ